MNNDEATSSLVVLGLGSNMGDSSLIIANAVSILDLGIVELRKASLYESDPLYVMDQNRFINTVVAGYYTRTPKELLYYICYIEARFGRDRARERRWGERFLDIDILLFEDRMINEPDLTIPHPLLKERRFALEPLLELLPDAIDPHSGVSYRDICQVLPDQGVKKLPATSEYCPTI